jgi:hypothetical protein
MADEELAPLVILTTMLVPMREPNEWQRQLVERDVPVSQLKEKLGVFIRQMRSIAEDATALGRTLQGDPNDADQRGEFLLEEMTFNAEVSPEGEFKLIGTGGQPSGGGVRFVWKRKHVFGTADLSKALLSSIPKENVLRSAVVGPKFEEQPLKIEVTNVVRTSIEDVVQVLLVGI